MGYDVHITRRPTWYDEGEPAISLEEWRSIIAEDPDLEPLSDEQAQMLNPQRRAARAFGYVDGAISVKKPKKAVLMEMLAIADKLGARVVGDDDEVYAADGTPSKTAQFVVTEDW